MFAVLIPLALALPSCSDSNDDPQNKEIPDPDGEEPAGAALTLTVRDVTSSTFSMDVKVRSDFKDNYYVGCIEKDYIDDQLSGYSDAEKGMKMALSFVDYACQYQEDVNLGIIDDYYVFSGDASISDLGRMWPLYAGTDYYVVAFGVSSAGVVTTGAFVETVSLPEASASSNRITLSVDVESEWTATGHVAATTSDFYYVDYCEKSTFDTWVNGQGENGLAEAIVEEICESGYNWRYYVSMGNRDLPFGNGMLYPGTEYVLFAFGIDGGVLRSTDLVKTEFKTPGDPLVLVDPEVSSVPFGSIALSDPTSISLHMEVQPDDPEMPYYVNWGTVSDFRYAGALSSDLALLKYDREFFETLRVAYSNMDGIDYKIFTILLEVCQTGACDRILGGSSLPLDSGEEQIAYAYGIDPYSGEVLTKIEKAYLSTTGSTTSAAAKKSAGPCPDVRRLMHKWVNCVELPVDRKEGISLTRFVDPQAKGSWVELR